MEIIGNVKFLRDARRGANLAGDRWTMKAEKRFSQGSMEQYEYCTAKAIQCYERADIYADLLDEFEKEDESEEL